ncbi:RNA polymerase II transcription factor B subunit 1 [Chamberlinius hualienensis]
MATSSEDVLLLVNNVRHQKKNGTLYLMDRRLAWIMDGKDVFSVSQNYSDIKTQKISPDGKAKVQLQIVLHDAGAATFHFTNPLGTEVQLKDRNDVKELLQQLLPKFKRKINKDLEDKNRILTENPDLLQLYRDLVTSQIITPEEFWNIHVAERQLNNKNSIQVQEVGVSGAFLADVKPQVDGCNGLKYNLNADLIRSIFKTYPAVKKKHLEYVPDKISESEFWTRFFQSHYFHRDRINSGNKDVFSECAKLDEQDIKKELQKAMGDPLHDVTTFTDSSLDDGYGIGVRDGPSTVNIANKNLIRRFNHYSMMVLKASESSSTTNSDESTETAVANETNGVKDADEPDAKRAKVIEKTIYEDLEGENEQKGVELSFQKKERYLHGPTPLVSDSEMLSNEDLIDAVGKMQNDLHQLRRNLVQALPSKVAVSVLKEFSPGGALMKASASERSEHLAPHVREEFQNLYNALVELLRHFWSCFPVTSKVQQEKVIRMRATLERFEYAKLKPFQDQLLRDHFQTNLTDHMKDMLEAAYAKFHNWQAKRVNIKL